MIIRQAEVNEYDTIYTLVEQAFKTAQVSDGDEQDFVLKLRSGEGYIPQLELVAEHEGEIIGHIMLTKLIVNGASGDITQLLLAPVCVSDEHRDKKVGSALINRSMVLAREMGYKGIFLCGNPDYYSRFGFVTTESVGIKNGTDIPDMYVQCCELIPNGLKNIGGSVKLV